MAFTRAALFMDMCVPFVIELKFFGAIAPHLYPSRILFFVAHFLSQQIKTSKATLPGVKQLKTY